MSMKISNHLQGVISQMLKPLTDLPLGIVIEGLSGYSVIPFNRKNKNDIEVLLTLKKVANNVLKNVNKKGILRTRPNEVGNDIETFVKEALKNEKYEANTPIAKSGKKKSTGYPDIEFIDKNGNIHYLECKTFNAKNINTTQRSFYISPSQDFKINRDAHHFGLSFEIYTEENIGEKHIYKVKSWKILDLSKLTLKIKYEFNADNKKLYDRELILAERK